MNDKTDSKPEAGEHLLAEPQEPATLKKSSSKTVESPKPPGSDFDREGTIQELKDCFAIMKGEFNKANLQVLIDLKKVG